MIDPETPWELAVSWMQRSHLAKQLSASAMRTCAADLLEMLDGPDIPHCGKCTHLLTEHLPSHGCAVCMREYVNDSQHEFVEWKGEDDE